MSHTLRAHIRHALANANLQDALDANAERRFKARQEAYASLPEGWSTMRKRAHQVRAETIANLERYLEQFIARAQANGMIVHQAIDAAQAVGLVLQIAARHEAHLVAKSKSMISEEIELNPALEAAGLKVVETDLGEWIVQLRGERPAHIITPAVHLKRAEVGRTFHQALGIPLTEEIPALVAAARQALRQVFLEAEIGLSGVNFGVAESGTLCIVTNEGNGRMVTSLPPAHIALMGVERLVPTLDDLALMLYLLPRSATGQKLSVYTSLIHSPRRPGEPDGPGERHLILVDNGRLAMRASPLAEALYCIRCGACLNACPVFREMGGHAYVGRRGQTSAYAGPIGSVISPGLFGQGEFGWLARASSLCGACREACPVDIDLPKLLLRVRAGGVAAGKAGVERHVPWSLATGLRLFTWLATHARMFGLTQRAAGLASRAVPAREGWLRLPAFTGWGFSKDLPRPAIKPFRSRWAAMADGSTIDAQPVVATTHPVHAPGADYSLQPIPKKMLMERFAGEWRALGGGFSACRTTELQRVVARLLESYGANELLVWEQGLPRGLLEALQAAGFIVHRPDYPQEKSLLAAAHAGLTGALAAVAESGTLVLAGGQGRPMAASLLPETHIVILRMGEVCASLTQALRLPEVRQASAAVLISGPSRTADIEMTLTIGVHGPRQAHVVCVTD